jgi:hypothetical protein
LLRDQRWGDPLTASVASGIKVARVRSWLEHGTWEPVASMPREQPKWKPHEGQSTDAGHRGGLAHSSVEVPVMGMERRGQITQFRRKVNQAIGRNPAGRRGRWPGDKSRMSREAPVRFREGLGVKSPRATRLVMGFTCEGDARRVMDVLPKRFEKYGLSIHPEKTKLVPFERPPVRPKGQETRVGTPAGIFDLLGFTHYWGRSREGYWVVKRKTSKSRFRRGLKAIAEWCRTNRHHPLAEQQYKLGQKLRGHFAYYGITGNAYALNRFRRGVVKLWRKWLGRRDRGGEVAWERMYRLLERHPLPPPIVVHSVYRNAAKV